MVKKAVVVHAEARDSYQLAMALQEKNLLSVLITDFYSNDLLYKMFPGIAGKRYQPGLPSSKTSICFEALLLSMKIRFQQAFYLNRQKDLSLSKKAFETSRSESAHLFCYSYYANYAFKMSDNDAGTKKLLFQLHPHPFSVKKLLLDELQFAPQASASLKFENELQYSDEYLKDLADESLMADSIVVASDYTKKTLIENGVGEEKIEVVPYGIDFNKFTRRHTPANNKHLRIIYVGSMVQRKGLSYLLEAVRKFAPDKVELVLCGRGFIDKELFNFYNNVKFTIKTGLSHTELLEELHRSDIFCLPSLCEGFAHVILEAMAAGLPVIATSHTCAPDIITDGLHGFIVPIRDRHSLVEKIEWCIRNKTSLYNMGQLAADQAQHFTWKKFREGIIRFYERSVNN